MSPCTILRSVLLAPGISILLIACDDAPPASPEASPPAADEVREIVTLDAGTEEAVRDLLAVYLQQADADFAQTETDIIALNETIDALLESGDERALAASREAWLRANNSFEASLLHRYLAEAVLPEQAALQLNSLNYALNYWPILPGYIDAVSNYPDSGLVHDVTVDISPANLRLVHGQFALSEVAIGFHVLEFLLWGENQDRQSPRPATDFLQANTLGEEHVLAGLSIEQLPNNRRRLLLDLLGQILLEDIRASRVLWNDARDLYAASLSDTSASVLLSQILNAVNSMLTEELLTRSLYPMLNGNYLDSIPSPYSHSSQVAVLAQLGSVERLLLDSITEDGNRLDGVLADLSADFEALFYQNLDASKECLALLYSDVRIPDDSQRMMSREFAIVECINLLTNLIDQFDQIEQALVVR